MTGESAGSTTMNGEEGEGLKRADELKGRYRQLPMNKQIGVLAGFGYNLTITARETYVVGELGVHAPERLRAINEIQHRILAHIGLLATQDERRYPDDVLLSIALEYGDEYQRARTLWALEDAMNREGA